VPGKTKRRRRRYNPFTGLERVLLEKPGIGKAFLFPSLAGRGTGGRTGLSGQFAKIMDRRTSPGPSIRHLRRTGDKRPFFSFATAQFQFRQWPTAGVSQEIPAEAHGHASGQRRHDKIYTHHEIEP